MSGVGLVLSLPNVGETVEAARMAEQAGFESVWTTDFTDRSATVAMAAIAAATERITIGSAIAYAFGHTPLVLAAEARDLDALSGGRIILGLGTGTKRMQQDWHGLDGEHPASRMEELVPLLRRLLRLHEGPIEHDGRFYRLRRPAHRAGGPADKAGDWGAMTDAVSDRMLDTVALAGTPREGSSTNGARGCSSARCCGRRPPAGWPPPRR